MQLVLYQGNTNAEEKQSENIQIGRRDHLYVGLSNQGATCYLNGLLQTLFMTPQFRRAIFKWQYNAASHGPEADSIPYQLQCLFGCLQLGKRRAVESIGLTKSFGWNGGEVYQQKDVQELALILFDRLEEDFKSTELEDMINQLYAGQQVDYLRCIDLDYESEREVTFLDFSLAIIPFGHTTALNSLIDCIEAYLTPEILDGDDKYYVESHQQKVDAIKGLKFSKLPLIMSIQLKRFALDMTSHNFAMRKVNDIVRFPMVLDMNKYVTKMRTKPAAASSSSTTPAADQQSSTTNSSSDRMSLVSDRGRSSSVGSAYDPAADEFERFLQEKLAQLRPTQSCLPSQTNTGAGTKTEVPDLVDCIGSRPPNSSPVPESESSGTTSQDPNPDADADSYDREQLSYTTADIPRLLAERGEWVYELFSVLVHSGAISGGHYYAYIKDVDTQKWWNFNDSNVTEVTEEKVKEAYGSSYSYSSNYNNGSYTGIGSLWNNSGASKSSSTSFSATNAYMLTYRKVSAHRPANCGSDEDSSHLPGESLVPSYIRELVAAMDAQDLERARLEEERLNRMTLKVWYCDKERVVNATRSMTYGALLVRLWDELHVHEDPAVQDLLSGAGIVPSYDDLTSRLRLRDYSHSLGLPTNIHDPVAKGTKTLADCNFYSSSPMLLELRCKEEEWEVYSYDSLVLTFGYLTEGAEAGDDSTAHSETGSPTMVIRKKIIRLPKGSSVLDLKKAVLRAIPRLSHLAPTLIRVLKLTEPAFNYGSSGSKGAENATTVEGLWCDDNKLESYQVFSNCNTLFVEELPEIDPERTVSTYPSSSSAKSPLALNASITEDSSPIFRIYTVSKSLIKIKFSAPGQSTASETLLADLRWTIGGLRSKVASRLQLDSAEVRLFKNHFRTIEHTDDTATLRGESFFEGYTMYTSKGRPVPPGYYMLTYRLHDVGYVKPAAQLLTMSTTLPSSTPSMIPENTSYGTCDNGAFDNAVVVEAIALGDEDDGGGTEEQIWSANATTTVGSVAVVHDEPNPVDESTSSPNHTTVSSSTTAVDAFLNARVTLVTTQTDLPELSCLHVTKDTKVDVWRQQIYEKLVASKRISDSCRVDNIRLRQTQARNSEPNPTKALRDDLDLQENDFFFLPQYGDCRLLIVEILSTPEKLHEMCQKKDILIYLRHFRRRDWTLSDPLEVIVPVESSVREVAEGIGRLFGIDAAALRFMSIPDHSRDPILLHLLPGRVSPGSSYNPVPHWMDPDLETKGDCKFEDANQIWKIRDGGILVFQDDTEELRLLTEAETAGITQMEEDAAAAKCWTAPAHTGSYASSAHTSFGSGAEVRIKKKNSGVLAESADEQSGALGTHPVATATSSMEDLFGSSHVYSEREQPMFLAELHNKSKVRTDAAANPWEDSFM